MKHLHDSYLRSLERMCKKFNPEDFYLWPRTPISDEIQLKIRERVGVSDYEVNNPHSRPYRIIFLIRKLQKYSLISGSFSVLDIACGDAIILWHIKNAFPESECYGVDSNKGKFPTHKMVQEAGVRLYNVFIQHLFRSKPPAMFDIVLMLNTYRGWESAGLREHEKELPLLADEWFKENSRYTIVTATDDQIRKLASLGFNIEFMGKGEDNSKMVCFSFEDINPGQLKFLRSTAMRLILPKIQYLYRILSKIIHK